MKKHDVDDEAGVWYAAGVPYEQPAGFRSAPGCNSPPDMMLKGDDAPTWPVNVAVPMFFTASVNGTYVGFTYQ
jgi:hypothetical protein